MKWDFLCFRSVILAGALILASAGPVFAVEILSVRFGSHPDRERIVVELSGKTEFRSFAISAPPRIVVDLPRMVWKAGKVEIPGGLMAKDVRYGDLGGGVSRLVIETGNPVLIRSAFLLPGKGELPDRLVIDVAATSAEVMSSLSAQVQGNLRGAVPAPKEGFLGGEQTQKVGKRAEKKMEKRGGAAPPPIASPKEKPLIVIDPGHGGQDPGAIGATGIYEKTIVLAVGKELARQLEASGRYRVKMTREADIFIPLRQRVMIARKHRASLFVSLHADSIRNAGVTGASVYTLSEKASDAETEKLAERENKSDLIAGVDLTHQEEDVASILIDLAARDTMNQSRFLANTVIDRFDESGVKVVDHNHRSAGFAVLKAMDIPSILVEMGYLTNRAEVVQLSTPAHRQKIARALRSGIDHYFEKVGK